MAPTAVRALAAIDAGGVVAILRNAASASVAPTVDALIAGGVLAIEVSLTAPDALAQIDRAVATAGGRAAIGAGTVLTRRQLRDVHTRGATFIVSPTTDPEIVGAALELDLVVLPGAFTPTEALAAHRLGAHAIKLFPADVLGSRFVRGLLAPLPGLKLVPTGGVSLELAREFVAAGAWAVGVGGPLVGDTSDPDAITTRARGFVLVMRPSAAA